MDELHKAKQGRPRKYSEGWNSNNTRIYISNHTLSTGERLERSAV